MGKHRGSNGDRPVGPGPHPTPEESEKKAEQFDEQYAASKKAGDAKNAKGEWRG